MSSQTCVIDFADRHRRERLARRYLEASLGMTVIDGPSAEPHRAALARLTPVDPLDLLRAVPDLSLEFVSPSHRGNDVAFVGLIRGRHWCSFDGIGPTGRAISVASRWIVRFEHSRPTSVELAVDETTLRVQLVGSARHSPAA